MKLSLIRLIFLIIVPSILLSACSKKDSDPAPLEIDTLNIFFEDQRIYSFNPETGITTSRAEFNEGDNQILPMNTNDDKQGFEYAAYAKTDELTGENKVFLFDYVSGVIRDLVEFNDHICGLHPDLAASSDSIDDDNRREKNFLYINKESLFVSVNDDAASCNPATDSYYQISFTVSNKREDEDDEDNGNPNIVSFSEVSSSHVLGEHVLDFRGDTQQETIEDEVDRVAPAAFIGFDIRSQELEIHAEAQTLDILLPTNLALPTIQQVTENEVIISSDYDIYIQDINQLLSFAFTESGNALEVPSYSIDELFELPEATIDSPSFSIQTGVETFILEDDSTLYIMKKGETLVYELIPFYTKPVDLDDVNYFVLDNGLIILHKIFADEHILSRIVESEVVENQFLETTVARAEKMEAWVDDNQVFVSTLDAVDLNGDLSTFDGWQAHIISTTSSSAVIDDSYPHSLFQLIRNINEDKSEAMIIKSKVNQSTGGVLEEPEMFFFDSEDPDGLRNIDGEPFSLGEFEQSIVGVLEREIINDIYGYIIVEDSLNEAHRYFFNPSELNETSLIPVNDGQE